MKNAIIINGETYELVENTTGKDVCKTCDLKNLCFDSTYSLCSDVHIAKCNEHYIKRQKGGET